jgi:predicted MFS family arabinose efflux permease
MSQVDVLLQELGGFGRYQYFVLVVGSIIHGLAAMQSMAFLFTGRTPTVVCATSVGGCRDDGSSAGCSWMPNYTLNSYVAEFGLVCGRQYLASLLTTGYFAGYALGAFVGGQLCDLLGRKPISVAALLLTCVFQVGSGFVPSFQLLFAARVGLGITFGGVSNATYTWFVEFFEPQHRSIVVSAIFTSYAFFCSLNSALGEFYAHSCLE